MCFCVCMYVPAISEMLTLPLHHHCVYLLVQPQMDSACNSDWHYTDVKQGVWTFFFFFFLNTFRNIIQNIHTTFNKQRALTQSLDEKQQSSSSDWLILVTKQYAGWEDDRWGLLQKMAGTPLSWFFNQSYMPSTPLSFPTSELMSHVHMWVTVMSQASACLCVERQGNSDLAVPHVRFGITSACLSSPNDGQMLVLHSPDPRQRVLFSLPE